MKLQSPIVLTGLYSYAGIALLFLILKIAGLESQTWLRFLNLVIVVYFTNRLARHLHDTRIDNDYLRAWVSLIFANIITVGLSLLSFVIYVLFIDPDFMKHFTGGILWNNHINIQQAALSLFTEGVGSAVAISFIIMQYWNDAAPAKTN